MYLASVMGSTINSYTQNMLSVFTTVLYLATFVNSLPGDLINTRFTRQIGVTGISSDPLSSVREASTRQCAGSCLALVCKGFALIDTGAETRCQLSTEISNLPVGQWSLYYSKETHSCVSNINDYNALTSFILLALSKYLNT